MRSLGYILLEKNATWNRPRESQIDIEKLKPLDANLQITTQPMEFFKQFITNELLEEITFHTNLYNTQRATRGYKTAVKRRGSSQTSFREIKPGTKVKLQQVFGIILYMGVHKLPSRRMYWGNKTVVPLIANTMSRNRCEEILSVFTSSTARFRFGPQYLYRYLNLSFSQSDVPDLPD